VLPAALDPAREGFQTAAMKGVTGASVWASFAIVLAFVLSWTSGCKVQPASPEPHQVAAVDNPAPAESRGRRETGDTSKNAKPHAPSWHSYGAGAPAGHESALSEILADPETFAGRDLVLSGTVRAACTRKGCWMEMTAPGGTQGCRVTFKDYAFFVPKDAAGSQARVAGRVHVQDIPAHEVEHMESEGARFARKRPDGRALEVRVVATGVELLR